MRSQALTWLEKRQDFVTFARGFSSFHHVNRFGLYLEDFRGTCHAINKPVFISQFLAVWVLFKVQEANKANAKAPTLDICALYQKLTLVSEAISGINIIGLAILLLEHKSPPPYQGDYSELSNNDTAEAKGTSDTPCAAC